MLTDACVFPYLPSLRVLNVSHTNIGDAAVASMPAGLEELHMVCCRNVTQSASLDHLTALRVLQSARTDLSSATIGACRARGCIALADGVLVPADDGLFNSLVSLPDGRLVRGKDGRLTLWENTSAGSSATAELQLHCLHANALAVLHDGYRVAVGTNKTRKTARDGIGGWDTRTAPHDTLAVTHLTIGCEYGVWRLAVAHNGWLVAGCLDGTLCVVDVDAGAVLATWKAHDGSVTAVIGLLDGRVASVANFQHVVTLWNMDTGACVATLAGHTDRITSLAVLSDGRFASGSYDSTVRLWDTVSGTCVRVLTGSTKSVFTLAVLPDNRLASMSDGDMIRVWDTRDDAGSKSPTTK